MKRIYIAGPMTQGNKPLNIRRGLKVGSRLWRLGFLPHVPHLTHFWDKVCPMPYEEWLKMDFYIIAKCDGLLRLKGPSPGADREVDFAELMGVPVFHSMKELLAHAWT